MSGSVLQLRVKGSTGQFYNPGRDMAYIWPKAVRAAVYAFDKFEGDSTCSKEEMCAAAEGLARLTATIIMHPTMPADTSTGLMDLDKKFPNAMPKIKNALFHSAFGVFTAWTMDVRPKTSDDPSIPTVGLDEVAEFMARETTKINEAKRNDGGHGNGPNS